MAAHAGDASGARILTLGLLSVDVPGGTASVDGRTLNLSRRHVELLAVLVANRNRVVSRAELSAALGFQRGRSIDVLLSALRHEMGFPFVRNVPKRGWMNGIGGCPNVGGICIGCTMPGFPDKFMPFMDEPPGAKLSTTVVQAWGGALRGLRKLTNDTVNKEPSWRHTGRELTTGYQRTW